MAFIAERLSRIKPSPTDPALTGRAREGRGFPEAWVRISVTKIQCRGSENPLVSRAHLSPVCPQQQPFKSA